MRLRFLCDADRDVPDFEPEARCSPNLAVKKSAWSGDALCRICVRMAGTVYRWENDDQMCQSCYQRLAWVAKQDRLSFVWCMSLSKYRDADRSSWLHWKKYVPFCRYLGWDIPQLGDDGWPVHPDSEGSALD